MGRRANVIGTGLIGGSIGMGLRAAGWHVTGRDARDDVSSRAIEVGAIDERGLDAAAEITFVATPVGEVGTLAADALARTRGVVTDVGSVKVPMLDLMADGRFVGGHPMAGSELEGISGARPDLFAGATWVLTPVDTTADATYTLVRRVVSSLGAEVISLPPDKHDALVAIVSHVPHLTAATLMRLADRHADERWVLRRLAAGGFRDMTRIAAGQPGIWRDICAENRDAIVAGLDALVAELRAVRDVVARDDGDALVGRLEEARRARVALPARFGRAEDLVELRLPIPDRAGVLAEITTLATDLGVSIADIEIAHSSEGPHGVLLLLVDAAFGDRLRDGLVARGYRPTVRRLA